MSDTTTIKYAKDSDGIVTLTIDDPSASANTMNEQFLSDYRTVVKQLQDEEDLAGVLLTSAKKTFFAGGNLQMLMSMGPDDADAFYDGII